MNNQKKIRFFLINFLFPTFHDSLNFEVGGVKLLFNKVENYKSIEESLRHSHEILETCYVDIEIINNEENTVEFIMKVNFLLSFCRGNIINFSRYIVFDDSDNTIREHLINPISTPYTSLELIPREFTQETQNFLSKAFNEYNEIDNLYMIRKLAREYPTTRNSSTFLHSRSLILTAMIEYILFRFNNKIGNLNFFDQKEYIGIIDEIKSDIHTLLENKFGDKNNEKIRGIINKMDGLNQSTLKWKFKSFIQEYKIPLSNKEMQRFINLRNHLAHTLSFTEKDDNIICWKFLITILEKI